MGLDTSFDCWHGAYSAFTRWRQYLAEKAGYAVWKVIDDLDGIARPTVIIDWGHITEENLFGKWDATPSDPLIVLIAHSDCEGKIFPAQAGPLADRLTELLPLLGEDDGGGHVGIYRDKTQKFIDGLRRAVEANQPVHFH